MPRRPRVFAEGGIYHVYNRFARGAGLFADPEEAIEFLEILRKARDRDGLTVFAWAMMSNHYHLAVRAGPVPLSRTMGYVQARFGQRYNRLHRSSGPRWQSRYKARMVEDPATWATYHRTSRPGRRRVSQLLREFRRKPSQSEAHRLTYR